MKGYVRTWMVIQILILVSDVGHCSQAAFFHREEGKYLANSVIETMKSRSEFECSGFCLRESYCVSVNYKVFGINHGMCELNNRTLDDSKQNAQDMAEYTNLAIVQRTCEEANQIFSPTTKRCASPQVANSCKSLLKINGTLTNGAYKISVNFSTTPYSVYCHMTNIPGCGGGGWTLIMKMDGTKETFGYDSTYWTNKKRYNRLGGLEGMTDKETKLKSYWKTPFTKICLGMKVNGVRKWTKLDYEATSLYSVIADGTFRPTTAGRDTWKRLIADASLQPRCNKEGFNIGCRFNIRVGIVANEYHSCNSCDSWVGFGVKQSAPIITTGNHATHDGDNGNKDTSAFGYILVS